MKYSIGTKIGSGSFGTVHEAQDSAGNRVAVKLVGTDDDVCSELLRSQYEFLASLHHKRIVRALDFVGDSSRGPMLVTELIDGVDIRTYVERRGLESLPLITAQILDGLRYLHGLGKVHGDLKPESILVCDRADGIEVKLIDAGFDYGAGSKLPTLVGTLPYIAPEIIRSLPGDGRSDLYSLGVVLHEILTGGCPFGGSTTEEILKKHLEYTPGPPSHLNPDIASPWDEFVGMLLKKEPFLRYRDAVHAGLELERMLGPPEVFEGSILPADAAPLLEREKALATLSELLIPSRGRSVLVRGGRGWGVSRLLREVEAKAKAGDLRVYTVSLSDEMPALGQVVDALLGERAARLDTAKDAMPEMSQAGIAGLDEVIRLFRALAPGLRHLLIVDRGEVMEAGELRLLRALASLLGQRLSVLIGYQSDEGSDTPLPQVDHFEFIDINPLGPDSVGELLKSHFGVSTVPSEFAEELYHATRGVPGLIDLTLSHLRTTGSVRIVARQGVLEVVWDKTIGIPTTFKEIMTEKLRSLTTDALRVLSLVSLGGGQMEKRLLASFIPPDNLDSVFHEVLGAGLTEAGGDQGILRLRRESLSPVLREMLSSGDIKDLSLRLASMMETESPSARDSYRLGVLYLDGGRLDKAFDHLLRSGDYFARFSTRDALLAYDKALRCAGSSEVEAEVNEKIAELVLARDDLDGASKHFVAASRVRPSARRRLGWVLALQGNLDEAVDALTMCRKAAAEEGDDVESARVLSDLGYVYSMQSNMDAALGALNEAQSIFESHGMKLERGLAVNRVGAVNLRSGDLKGAQRAWIAAKADFEQIGDRRRVAICLLNLGLCYRRQMDLRHAEESFREALAIFEDVKALYEEASCRHNYALVLLDRGDLGGARRLAEEAFRVNTLLGRGSAIATAAILLGAVAIESGNWVEAENRLLGLVDGQFELDSYGNSMIRRYLAASKAMRGNFNDASDLADESYALACEADDAEGQGQAMLMKAQVLLRAGRSGEALVVARKASMALGLSSSLLQVNNARRLVGEARCLCGELAAGIGELMDAMEGFEILPESLHMGRVLRALALGYHMEGDHESFHKYLDRALQIFRGANARYDYAQAILLGGQEAMDRGNLLLARRYLQEAARIFKTLNIEDLEKKAVEEMARIPSGDLEVKAVTSLSKISQTLSSSHDLTTVLNLAMDLAIEYLGAERGVLMLEDEATGDLTTFVEREMDKESLREVIGISRSIVDSVRSTGESVLASDASKDPRFKDSKSVRIHNIMSVMCVPLTVGGRLLGVIYLDSRGVPSGFSTVEKAFVGAFANQVSLAIENAKLVGRLYDSVVDLRARAGEKYSFSNIVGPGKKMQEVFRQVDKAAKSTITIMLTGASGTGKELIAGLVHELSPRRDKPLVTVNCAAIQRDLLETELFGIEKRVATGIAPRSGFFERANGGTIFLDEVGDMPLTTQMKVLRVLAAQEFERVGGSKVLKVDVRVVSATNQDLKDMIGKGLFRKDLYYRLNAMRIHLPPLRERREDIADLVEYFIGKYASQNSKPKMSVSPSALGILKMYFWPGNVRELEKCIEHAVVVTDGAQIDINHLPDEVLGNLRTQQAETAVSSPGRESLPAAKQELEKRMIMRTLSEAGGVQTVAAQKLGIHESTLRKKMKALGIPRSNQHRGR